ncbi:zinc finger protein 696-like [Tachyglossus aculeatus]|uniref:zinc finger protein 696-like n=1 Tax=Tachyglossus aculeatus TaxID=9261 RepID=UPI0018F42C70|nr:zinc finger protein 696-like [Tachyglossus aculeatus]
MVTAEPRGADAFAPTLPGGEAFREAADAWAWVQIPRPRSGEPAVEMVEELEREMDGTGAGRATAAEDQAGPGAPTDVLHRGRSGGSSGLGPAGIPRFPEPRGGHRPRNPPGSESGETPGVGPAGPPAGVRPHRCPDCGKAFGLQSTLLQHRRVHSGQKPFVCPDCAKAFRQSSHLVRHQRIHTEEKPYRCARCARAFNRRTTLLRHQRVHTGERPYRCPDCGRAFGQSSNLAQHRRIHARHRPHPRAPAAGDRGPPARHGP